MYHTKIKILVFTENSYVWNRKPSGHRLFAVLTYVRHH
jgi:hypothetical protein